MTKINIQVDYNGIAYRVYKQAMNLALKLNTPIVGKFEESTYYCHGCNQTHSADTNEELIVCPTTLRVSCKKNTTIKKCECGANSITSTSSAMRHDGCNCSKMPTKCPKCNATITSHPYMNGNSIFACDKCIDKSLLQSYNSTKLYTFATNEERFGIELEISGTGNGGTAVRTLSSILPSIAVSDGSVSNGMEVVTDPFSFEGHLALNYEKFFSEAKKLGLTKSSSCGMHIHTGINSFDSIEHLVATLWIANNLHKEYEVAVRRKPGGYCKERLGGLTAPQILEQLFTNTDSAHFEKYSILNIKNPHTIEFRLPDGATSQKDVLSSLAMYKSIIAVAQKYKLEISNTAKSEIMKEISSYFKALIVGKVGESGSGRFKMIDRLGFISRFKSIADITESQHYEDILYISSDEAKEINKRFEEAKLGCRVCESGVYLYKNEEYLDVAKLLKEEYDAELIIEEE